MQEGYASDSPSRAASPDQGQAGATPKSAPARDRRSVAEFLFQGRSRTLCLLIADAVLLTLGNVATVLGAPDTYADAEGAWLIWLLPPLVLALFASWRLYRDRIALRLVDGVGQLIAATALATTALIAGAAVLNPSFEAASLLGRAWLFGTAYVVGGRIVFTWAQRRARAGRLIFVPTLIVGAGQVGGLVERRLNSQPQLGLLPVGYLDADPPPADMVPDRKAPVLGGPEDLGSAVEETGAGHVVLGFSSAPDRLLVPLVRECELRGLQVSVVPRLFESVNVRLALVHLGGLPLFGLHSIDPKGWQFTAKHVFDQMGAAALLLLLSPLLAGPRARRPPQLARPGVLPPVADRPRRPPLPDPQVPLHAPGGARRRGAARERLRAPDRHQPRRHRGGRPADPARDVHAPHLPRRAAAAAQRPARET